MEPDYKKILEDLLPKMEEAMVTILDWGAISLGTPEYKKFYTAVFDAKEALEIG